MADLNTDHGSQASAVEAQPVVGTTGPEAGTVEAPKGQVMFGVKPEGQPGNTFRLH
jgi:nicotinamide mononucleotide (NMN) deamidase PncC